MRGQNHRQMAGSLRGRNVRPGSAYLSTALACQPRSVYGSKLETSIATRAYLLTGVFQTYYTQNLLRTHSASAISWIGTIQLSLCFLGALYAGLLYDAGYLRSLMIVGNFLAITGMFMTSLAKEYWQFMLTQGILTGLGLGCLFTPCTGAVAAYFTTKRGRALAVVFSGAPAGGVIFSIAFDRSVSSIGHKWATRLIAFVMLLVAILPVLAFRQLQRPPTVRRLVAIDALKEAAYDIFTMNNLVSYCGLYVPFFYIQLYAAYKGVNLGSVDLYLVSIINAFGIPGRLVRSC